MNSDNSLYTEREPRALDTNESSSADVVGVRTHTAP
jgi:hypothetical protein